MKYNKIITFFGLALPVSVLLRCLQLFFTIDASTGFFLNEFKSYGKWITVAIIVFVALMALFSFLTHRRPKNPPEKNMVTGIASIPFAFSILFETFSQGYPVSVQIWQHTFLRIFALAMGVFLMFYAVSCLTNFKMPAIFTIVPIIYYIMKIICDFTAISSLALISDNVFTIAAYCVVLLFMLFFAKHYNSVEDDKGFKRILASGLSAVLLCLTQSIPHFICDVLSDSNHIYTSSASNLSIFFAGVFIATFLFKLFNIRNIE